MVIWCTKHQDWFLKFITTSWAIKYSFLRQSWPVSYICIASHLPITRCEMCQIFWIKCTRHITAPIAIEALLLNFYRGYWQSSDFCPKYVAWFNMISESSEITWLFFFFFASIKTLWNTASELLCESRRKIWWAVTEVTSNHTTFSPIANSSSALSQPQRTVAWLFTVTARDVVSSQNLEPYKYPGFDS